MGSSKTNFSRSLEIENRRHIFSLFRREVRFVVGPIHLAFGFLDYLNFPDQWPVMLVLRASLVAYLFLAFEFLKNPSIRRRFSQEICIIGILIATATANYMIYSSGGYSSPYILAMFLITVTGNRMCRLDHRYALTSDLLAYLPTCLIIGSSLSPDFHYFGITQISLLLGMIVLTWIFSSADESALMGSRRFRVLLNSELRRLAKSEFLKNNFPAQLRVQVEAGTFNLNRPKLVPNAVVGFADIASSAAISNSVGFETDWALKEAFLIAATKRATDCGFIVLTHTGDGFLFVGNYQSSNADSYDLSRFFSQLNSDFLEVAQQNLPLSYSQKTGIKGGVAMGPTVIGFIGGGQSYFTAMGPNVNLAARLCSKARAGELVVASRVWQEVGESLQGIGSVAKHRHELKGFSQVVPAYHVDLKVS